MRVGKVVKKVKAPQRQVRKAGEKGIPVDMPKIKVPQKADA